MMWYDTSAMLKWTKYNCCIYVHSQCSNDDFMNNIYMIWVQLEIFMSRWRLKFSTRNYTCKIMWWNALYGTHNRCSTWYPIQYIPSSSVVTMTTASTPTTPPSYNPLTTNTYVVASSSCDWENCREFPLSMEITWWSCDPNSPNSAWKDSRLPESSGGGRSHMNPRAVGLRKVVFKLRGAAPGEIDNVWKTELVYWVILRYNVCIDGFQMSNKRPTSKRQMHDQEAAVQWSFHFERSSFFTVYSGKLSRNKLSRIGEKYNFCGENFRECSLLPCQRMPHPHILWRKLLQIATKLRNSWKFSLSKVSCYTVSFSTNWCSLYFTQSCTKT